MAHILIIDDDPAVLRLFGDILECARHSVILASDGRKGLRILQEQRPDLVVTDIMMPEMDGMEVLQEISTNHASLPVIAISGGMRSSTADFVSRALQLGACRVLEKPIAVQAFLVAVNEVLGANGEKMTQSSS
jgi:DNA-binding NtrC family response regulator